MGAAFSCSVAFDVLGNAVPRTSSRAGSESQEMTVNRSQAARLSRPRSQCPVARFLRNALAFCGDTGTSNATLLVCATSEKSAFGTFGPRKT
jgi:hypothetical protein